MSLEALQDRIREAAARKAPLRLRGGGINRSITVRSIRSGVGVERTFKVNSPRIEKIEVVRHGEVRRAQLYFLRKRVGKAASLRERRPS